MFKFLLGLSIGALSVFLVSDVVSLLSDSKTREIQQRVCPDPEQKCYFSSYYDIYKEENPTLYTLDIFFIDPHTFLYYPLSKRCTAKIYRNDSNPDASGQVTNREYFLCNGLQNTISDVLFGDMSEN